MAGAVSGRLRTTRAVLTAARLARADRRGVTLAALVGAGCHLCGPAVACAVAGASSATLTLAGWLLRPLYPVLPLLTSARVADRPGGAG